MILCIANRPCAVTPNSGQSRTVQQREGVYKCKAEKVWQSSAGQSREARSKYDATHARYVRNTRDGLAMVG